MKEFWEITYYGYGMTPLYKTFDNEAAARDEWDKMKNDPHSGAYCLKNIWVLEVA